MKKILFFLCLLISSSLIGNNQPELVIGLIIDQFSYKSYISKGISNNCELPTTKLEALESLIP